MKVTAAGNLSSARATAEEDGQRGTRRAIPVNRQRNGEERRIGSPIPYSSFFFIILIIPSAPHLRFRPHTFSSRVTDYAYPHVRARTMNNEKE